MSSVRHFDCLLADLREYDELIGDSNSEGRVIQCSACDNSIELSDDEITEQMAIDDGWLLEPVVWCPLHGPDDE